MIYVFLKYGYYQNFFIGVSYMESNKNKLKCRYCGSEALYLEEQIVTKSMLIEGKTGIIVYENGDFVDDEIVEEFTCYRCDSCGSKLCIDNEYSSNLVVTEKNLEEYRQKYCSGN